MEKMKVDKKKAEALVKEIMTVVEQYKDALPPYEVIESLMCVATSISFWCAQNKIVAFQTLLSTLQRGLDVYKNDV